MEKASRYLINFKHSYLGLTIWNNHPLTGIQGLHVLADILVWLAYLVIPLLIIYFLRKKPDIPLQGIFWLFCAFILTSGLTYLLDALSFWRPAHGLLTLVLSLTAIISWLTVGAIIKFFPDALALRTSRDYEKELGERKKSEARFMGLLESAPDAMIITGSNGKILMINAQTENLFGYNRNEIIGREIEILVPERFRTQHTGHRKGYVNKPKVRGMGLGMELFGKRKNGNEFPVEISLSPLIVEEEKDVVVISAIRDISKQKESEAVIKILNENLEQLVIERTAKLELALQNEKSTLTENARLYKESQDINAQLENRVAKRTQELEAINKELEAFSYSVSHDLRTPLRGIDGFCNKILRDYGEQLDDQAKDYFRRVINASQRMGSLIDDLLKLARLSRVEMHLEPINLSAMADSIIFEMKSADPERNASFVIQPEMLVKADRNLMLIAMQNLLGNAWKYSKNEPFTQIEFKSFSRDGQIVYFIRDNGVGFDMKYVDKLFGAFQRLHSVSEFEGTGIGLATVQRIIRRHHGRIWAESELKKGTTFYFTL